MNNLTPKRATYANYLISIVFAAAMIGSSLMIDDKDISLGLWTNLLYIRHSGCGFLQCTDTKTREKRELSGSLGGKHCLSKPRVIPSISLNDGHYSGVLPCNQALCQ